MWEVSGLGHGCQSGYRSGDLNVRVDIGVVTSEAMIPQCWRSVVQVLVVRADIGVVNYEAMTPQCRRSVVQVLVARVCIGVLACEAVIPSIGSKSKIRYKMNCAINFYFNKLKKIH